MHLEWMPWYWVVVFRAWLILSMFLGLLMFSDVRDWIDHLGDKYLNWK